MCTTRNSIIECSGSTFQRADSACTRSGNHRSNPTLDRITLAPMMSLNILRPPSSQEGDNTALVALFSGTRRAIRLSIRWIADDLYLARLRPRTGSHADVHIDSFIAHLVGQGRKRLSIHHRINARFIDLARSRPLLDFDQLCPPVRIQFEADPHRFTAGAPPDTTDLLRPTATHQDTHLLPIGFPAPGIGKRHQIFFRQTASRVWCHIWLHFIDDEVTVGWFLGTYTGWLGGIAGGFLSFQRHINDPLHESLESVLPESGKCHLDTRSLLMNGGPARRHRFQCHFCLQGRRFGIGFQSYRLWFKKDRFAKRHNGNWAWSHSA